MWSWIYQLGEAETALDRMIREMRNGNNASWILSRQTSRLISSSFLVAFLLRFAWVGRIESIFQKWGRKKKKKKKEREEGQRRWKFIRRWIHDETRKRRGTTIFECDRAIGKSNASTPGTGITLYWIIQRGLIKYAPRSVKFFNSKTNYN